MKQKVAVKENVKQKVVVKENVKQKEVVLMENVKQKVAVMAKGKGIVTRGGVFETYEQNKKTN